jgi:hypothetical protein
MPDHGSRQSVYLPDAGCQGVELAVDRLCDAGPSGKGVLSCGGPARREAVEGGFGIAGGWERVADFVVGARQ